jgi:hypothetical protein
LTVVVAFASALIFAWAIDSVCAGTELMGVDSGGDACLGPGFDCFVPEAEMSVA